MDLFCHSCKKSLCLTVSDRCKCEGPTLWVSKEELYLDEAVIIAKFKEEVKEAIANVPSTSPSLEWNENCFDFDDFDDWDEFIVSSPESRNCDNDGDEDYSEFEQFMEELFG